MRGDRAPLQQPGAGEHEGAVADRAEPLRPPAGPAQPGVERHAETHERQLRPARHQQQVVRLERFAEMPMGIECQTVGARHHPALDADHLQPIVILRGKEAIGLGKHIHGAGDIQRLNAGEHHDGYGFTHGSKSLSWHRLQRSPVGASLLAMDVNDDGSWLDVRGALTCIASKLAPTGSACTLANPRPTSEVGTICTLIGRDSSHGSIVRFPGPEQT
ncbi:hypothetical protein D3C73_815060 [compost metagenome]